MPAPQQVPKPVVAPEEPMRQLVGGPKGKGLAEPGAEKGVPAAASAPVGGMAGAPAEQKSETGVERGAADDRIEVQSESRLLDEQARAHGEQERSPAAPPPAPAPAAPSGAVNSPRSRSAQAKAAPPPSPRPAPPAVAQPSPPASQAPSPPPAPAVPSPTERSSRQEVENLGYAGSAGTAPGARAATLEVTVEDMGGRAL